MSQKGQNRRDCYEVLGISKTSNLDEIKKAYKKLAMKWHPDKNPNDMENAKQKFREISEAYEILSDPEKRKNYDNYGFQGPKMGGFSGFNFSDADSLFERFFRASSFDTKDDEDFFSSFVGRRKNGKKAGFGMGFPSMFDNDDFFGRGFGRAGGFGKKDGGFGNSFGFDEQPQMKGTGFGLTRSTSTTTKTVNGVTTTTKKTTVFKQDGTQEVTEEVIDGTGKQKLKKTYSLGPAYSASEGESKQVKYK